jgi:hypothetical protein
MINNGEINYINDKSSSFCLTKENYNYFEAVIGKDYLISDEFSISNLESKKSSNFNFENEENINNLFNKNFENQFEILKNQENKNEPEKTTKEYSSLKKDYKDSNLYISPYSVPQKKIIKIAEKIFNIVKEKKKNTKIGRANKNSKNKYHITHDKFSMDNIIRKIKASFLLRTMKFINHEYGEYLRKRQRKKIAKLIQPISPDESRKIKKEDNLKWFDLKIKDFYSNKISAKCHNHEEDENKIKIKKLYNEEKDKSMKIFQILEMKIKEMYDIYINDEIPEGFEEYKNLKDDIDKLKEDMKKKNEEGIEKYISEYEKTAKNLYLIFIEKKSRNIKK